jgi:hypothetical protein
MPRELHTEKLSDEFGQYEISLGCKCDYTRTRFPKTLAAIGRGSALARAAQFCGALIVRCDIALLEQSRAFPREIAADARFIGRGRR